MKAFVIGNQFELTSRLIQRLAEDNIRVTEADSPEAVAPDYDLAILEAPLSDEHLAGDTLPEELSRAVRQLAGKRSETGILAVITPHATRAEADRSGQLLYAEGVDLYLSQGDGLDTAVWQLAHVSRARGNALPITLKDRPARTPVAQGPLTWLIVEDDPPCRDAIEKMCALRGFEFISLASGFEASDWIAGVIPSPLPDVALVDIRLPGPYGHEVAAQLRQHTTLRNIPIILMTAMYLPGDQYRDVMEVSQADLLLFKPLPDMDHLVSQARRLMQARGYHPETMTEATRPSGSTRRSTATRRGGKRRKKR